MKVVVKTGTTSDDLKRESLTIDGKERLWVGPLCDCPEDAIIGRSLVSCSDVASYMQQAYEAGQRGEEFEIVTEAMGEDE